MRPGSWQFCEASKNCSLASVISKYDTMTEYTHNAQPMVTFSQASVSTCLCTQELPQLCFPTAQENCFAAPAPSPYDYTAGTLQG